MPPIRFRPDLSFGNIITIVTVIVGLTVGWQVMAADVRSNRANIDTLDLRVTATERRLSDTLDRMSEERVQMTQILTELRADVRYLRLAVDELKGQQ